MTYTDGAKSDGKHYWLTPPDAHDELTRLLRTAIAKAEGQS